MSLFGGKDSGSKPIFGSSTSPSLFGTFSNNDESKAKSTTGTFSFGASNSATNATSTPSNSGSALFGSNSASLNGTNVFGKSIKADSQKDTAASPFSSKPLFGSSSAGVASTHQQSGNSLFGSKNDGESVKSSTGLFGATSSANAGESQASSNLFTSSNSSETKTNGSSSLYMSGNSTVANPFSGGSGGGGSLSFGNQVSTVAKKTEENGGQPQNSATEASVPGEKKASDSLFGVTTPAKPQEEQKSTSLFGATPKGAKTLNQGKNVTFDLNKNTTKTIPGNDKSGEVQAAPEKRESALNLAALELNGMSIERIIGNWHERLDNHLALFAKTAEKVRERDLLLFENQSKITALAKQAQILKAEQDELQWNLDSVADLQVELNNSLDLLEKEVDELQSKKPRVYNQEAAEARKEAYEAVSNLSTRLQQVNRDVESAGDRLGELQAIKVPDRNNVKSVLEALKTQEFALQHLGSLTRDLEVEMRT